MRIDASSNLMPVLALPTRIIARLVLGIEVRARVILNAVKDLAVFACRPAAIHHWYEDWAEFFYFVDREQVYSTELTKNTACRQGFSPNGRPIPFFQFRPPSPREWLPGSYWIAISDGSWGTGVRI